LAPIFWALFPQNPVFDPPDLTPRPVSGMLKTSSSPLRLKPFSLISASSSP
jgi:hypothetical protein